MGATDFSHKFKHYKWEVGVRELQEEATRTYGHKEGYSGAINSCSSFSLHRPVVQLNNERELLDYVDKRLEHISKRDGEVIDLGIVGYSIAKPIVSEYCGSIMLNPRTLIKLNRPAMLINGNGFVVSTGTQAEMKEQGKRLVMKEKFEHDYYIVGKNTNKVLVVTGEGKIVKSTSKKSDYTQLVLPMHNFIVYGVAPS